MPPILAKSTQRLFQFALHLRHHHRRPCPFGILSLPVSPLPRGKRGQRTQWGPLLTPLLPTPEGQDLEKDRSIGV